MVREVSTKLGIGNRYQMSTWAHEQSLLPDFPYLRATSAHSAAVQLYMRSSLLPATDILVERGKLSSNHCRLVMILKICTTSSWIAGSRKSGGLRH